LELARAVDTLLRMPSSVPLFAIGLLLALGAGAQFVLPGSGARSTSLVTQPAPSSAVSRLYLTLLEQATVKPKAVPSHEARQGAKRAATSAPAVASPQAIQPLVVPPVLAPPNMVTRSVVGAHAVNVRAAAKSGSAVVAVLQPGQVVSVGATVNGWTEVSLSTRGTGWVYARYLASSGATPLASKSPTTFHTRLPGATVPATAKASLLVGRRARLGSSFEGRAGPSEASPVRASLAAGSAVRIIEVRGGWLNVVTADGTSAWIRHG